MKLAVVIPGYQADAQDWCIPAFTNLAHELARHVEVHVFALRYPPRRACYTIGNVHVHAIGGGAFNARRLPIASLINLWRQTIFDIRAEHARAPLSALVGIWATESGWLATRAAEMLGLPSLVHLAGGELTWLPDIRYGNRGVPLERVLVGSALRSASVVTTPSTLLTDAARRYLGSSGSKVLPWSLGVDTSLFVPATRAVAERVLTYLTVGSLIPVKGYERLLEAFAMLRRDRPHFQFTWIIAGSGSLRAQIERSIQQSNLQGHVSYVGDVPHERLPALLNEADCFVIGSRHEAQCMAALEAMSCGLPWIAPPVGALVDCAADLHQSGILVVGPTAAGLCGALRQMADTSPEQRTAWGANARQQVLERYELRTQTAQLLSTLRQLTTKQVAL